MSETTATKPGIYPGMSYPEYQAINAMNCSTLEWAKISTDHLHAAITGRLDRKDSKAMAFGRAIHMRLLEPERFASAVQVRGQCSAIISSGKAKGERCSCDGVGVDGGGIWFCGKHGGNESTLASGIEYLTAEQMAALENASAALARHKVEALRRARGHFEVVAVAELFGVLCKGRLDKYIESPCTVVDVKKVAAATSPSYGNISTREFEGRIANMGYGMRAAFYCDLIHKITGTFPRWYWLLIEDGEPFKVEVMRATDACLQAGRNEYAGYLTKYKRGIETNWKNDHEGVHEVDGPTWWLKENGVSV